MKEIKKSLFVLTALFGLLVSIGCFTKSNQEVKSFGEKWSQYSENVIFKQSLMEFPTRSPWSFSKDGSLTITSQSLGAAVGGKNSLSCQGTWRFDNTKNELLIEYTCENGTTTKKVFRDMYYWEGEAVFLSEEIRPEIDKQNFKDFFLNRGDKKGTIFFLK